MFPSIIRNATVVLASILLAVAYNIFLLPLHLQNGGVTGVGMIIAALAEQHLTGLFTADSAPDRLAHLLMNSGLVILLLNIPIFLLGFVKLGKRSFGESLISRAFSALDLFPERAYYSEIGIHRLEFTRRAVRNVLRHRAENGGIGEDDLLFAESKRGGVYTRHKPRAG